MRISVIAALLLLPACWAAARLSPLAKAPDWSDLNVFQESITHDDFLALLEKVYAPNGAWKDTITLSENGALITTHPGAAPFFLRFAPSHSSTKSITRFWRSRNMLPSVEPGKPLAGLKIALDPGHLGGRWAKMEERWFQIGNTKPVTEGDMTLRVARLLSSRLEDLGAQVHLTRRKAAPTTSLRPRRLQKAATASLADKGIKATPDAIKKESERLFYRIAEIDNRARLINKKIRPDLVICLHFNAEEWGDPDHPSLVNANHLHFLVMGTLSSGEMSYEDQRFSMLVKLLNRSASEEIAIADVLSRKMADATGLPPYRYESAAAVRVNKNPYVWARNLLANRTFRCPVIYVEAYVMNSRSAFARIQAGDYKGRRVIGGAQRRSIYREYADAIADGLVAYYSKRPL